AGTSCRAGAAGGGRTRSAGAGRSGSRGRSCGRPGWPPPRRRHGRIRARPPGRSWEYSSFVFRTLALKRSRARGHTSCPRFPCRCYRDDVDKGGPEEEQGDARLPAVEARLRAVFGRRPDLHRFVIEDKAGLADHIDRENLVGELFITQITLYPRHGARQYDEVYDAIARAVTQVVAELPEALNFLRGRTFVRAIH